MAAVLSPLEEDLLCPLCCEVFRDPVILRCSHSLCRACLLLCLSSDPLSHKCPVCRSKVPAEDPPRNLALRNLCETFLRERGQGQSARPGFEGPQCGLHQHALALFCLEDEELVCADCVCSAHRDHRFCHVKKAAGLRKEALRTARRTLNVKLGAFKAARDGCDQMGQFVRSQCLDAGSQIRAEFEKLHEALRRDMAARLEALEQEEAKKLRWVESRAEKLEKEISNLSDALCSTKHAISDQDICFLQ
ncbi:hypothetical protein AAFF_G00299560, partial [Aldrovandia affinis]